MRSVYLFIAIFFYTTSSAQTSYPSELLVSQDGTGTHRTIQEAINSTRDLGRKNVTIRIKKGIYKEKLVIPSWKTHISLIGEDKHNTIITGDDYSGKEIPNGQSIDGQKKFNTYITYTVLVEGNNIHFENLTIQNTAGRVGQAVALHVEGDRFSAVNCNILGNQDTLYTAKEGSKQFYKDCLIEGTTDFIFGEATCLFMNCTIKSLSNSYITAAAQRENSEFGFVFIGCKLIASPEATKVYLGRPWRPTAKTVFIECELGAHITPAGWDPWPGDAMFPDKYKTAYYAEYKNTGPGANTDQRVDWAKKMNGAERRKFKLVNVIGDWYLINITND